MLALPIPLLCPIFEGDVMATINKLLSCNDFYWLSVFHGSSTDGTATKQSVAQVPKLFCCCWSHVDYYKSGFQFKSPSLSLWMISFLKNIWDGSRHKLDGKKTIQFHSILFNIHYHNHNHNVLYAFGMEFIKIKNEFGLLSPTTYTVYIPRQLEFAIYVDISL